MLTHAQQNVPYLFYLIRQIINHHKSQATPGTTKIREFSEICLICLASFGANFGLILDRFQTFKSLWYFFVRNLMGLGVPSSRNDMGRYLVMWSGKNMRM